MELERKYRVVFYSSLMISVIAATGYAWYIVSVQAESGLLSVITASSLVEYLSILFVFLAVFLLARLVWLPFEKSLKGSKELQCTAPVRNGVIVLGLLLECGLAFLWIRKSVYGEFYAEIVEEWPISQISMKIMLLIAALILLNAAAMVYRNGDISRMTLWTAYAVCMILVFFTLYCTSMFVGDYWHESAALENIFNVCDLVPFTNSSSSIYGHYALFFLLPMRLFGGTTQVAAAQWAVVGCITYAAVFYAADYFLPKDWLKAVSACAAVICTAVLRPTVYWQVQPLRVFFPMLLCAYVIYLKKHGLRAFNTRWMWPGYLLGSLGVVWNTETGVFCLLAFTACLFTESWQVRKWYRCWLTYLEGIGLCALGIALEVLILNVYNLACGGPLIFKDCFFPLFATEYYTTEGRVDMIAGNHPWVYALILFFFLLGWGLSKTSLFRNIEDCGEEKAPIAVLISALGLFSIYYYANRAAVDNLDICFPMAVCAIDFLIGHCWPSLCAWKKKGTLTDLSKKLLGAVSIAALCGLASQIVLSPIRLASCYETGYWNTAAVKAELLAVGDVIAEDTYGVGGGISEIYHALGRTNYAHVIDASDWQLIADAGKEEELAQEVVSHSSYLLGMNTGENFTSLLAEYGPDFVLADVIYVQGYEFYYYVKVE